MLAMLGYVSKWCWASWEFASIVSIACLFSLILVFNAREFWIFVRPSTVSMYACEAVISNLVGIIQYCSVCIFYTALDAKTFLRCQVLGYFDLVKTTRVIHCDVNIFHTCPILPHFTTVTSCHKSWNPSQGTSWYNSSRFHDSLQVVTSRDREIHRKVQVDITRHEFRHESCLHEVSQGWVVAK